jgi:hypothetical protein
VALQRVQAITMFRGAVVTTGEVSSSRFGVLPDFLSITCFVLLVMDLGPRFPAFFF